MIHLIIVVDILAIEFVIHGYVVTQSVDFEWYDVNPDLELTEVWILQNKL